jgi:hypothetical protein
MAQTPREKPDSRKIDTIKISGFRGIAQTLELSLRSQSGIPGSLLIVGDNGVGKSSIVDAIEFALQARIGRRQKLFSSESASPRSLAEAIGSAVSICFTDGSGATRTLEQDSFGNPLFDKNPVRGFDRAPLVLRRSDILSFWTTPIERRQVLFFDFFSPPSEAPLIGPARDQYDQLAELRQAKKDARRELTKELAAKLEVDVDAIPLDRPLFETFVRDHVYFGQSNADRKVARFRGEAIRAHPAAEPVVKKLQKNMEEIGKLNRQMKEVRQTALGKDLGKGRHRNRTKEALEQISNDATRAFKTISPSSAFVEHIYVEASLLTEVSLSFGVKLTNGKVVSPQMVFSEANLDLLAFLIYIYVAKQAELQGQARLLSGLT